MHPTSPPDSQRHGWTWLTPPPEAWHRFAQSGTVRPVEPAGRLDFTLLHSGLPEEVPPTVDRTLFEEMLWALLARPHCAVVVYPLHASLAPDAPPRIVPTRAEEYRAAMRDGFLALCRPEAAVPFRHGELDEPESVACRSRALLDDRGGSLPRPTDAPPAPSLATRLRARVRAQLTPAQWAWLKRQAFRFRAVLSTGPAPQPPPAEPPLALRRHWSPPFPRPAVDVSMASGPERVPVWIAMHWLDLGGAERFAIDLIRALPRERYAVHVTTDVPSENPWAAEIRDRVEEILHLPAFLPEWMIGVFCEHFVRTRGIRLLHLHHAPRVYESLFHIRRFHPDLIVLQTLHILELPPHSGGYPEWAMAHFGTFIDHHHVISDQLRRFLRERWLVPDDRITLVRVNVDLGRFDPATIAAGTVRGRCGIPRDALVVAFVGRLTRQKRPLDFVRLATLLGQAWQREGGPEPLHFVIAGAGELEPEVRAAIAASPVAERIHFVGPLSDPRPLYRDADLVVLPSENEGLALVTYEAMAMGTPVFSTDVGAQSELLDREQLVPDAGAVAPALADRLWPYLLDGQRRKALAIRQQAYVRRHHDATASLDAMERLYARLLRGTPPVARSATSPMPGPAVQPPLAFAGVEARP